MHQLLNAAGALAALHVLGQDCDVAVEQLGYFQGGAAAHDPGG
ncbi:hypothetical protein ACFPH6_48285 [Streptomyces xiangluensis]|uniref:Uncharacterized protein n=1 Tax=Streptomyces xiangluensis TaxID=2665720 RepID=A0ABV8Z797_9ACTN